MIKTMSIIKEANKWFVTFSVELNSLYQELNVNTNKTSWY